MADLSADMIFAPLNMPDSSGAQATNSVTPAASPFTYHATSRQAIHIVGGAVSAVTYARGSTTLAVGLQSGGQIFELNEGDAMTITYSGAPTITMIPR
jgi:hypothetical protein